MNDGARGLIKLLANSEIAESLKSKAPEILEKFEAIAATTSLQG